MSSRTTADVRRAVELYQPPGAMTARQVAEVMSRESSTPGPSSAWVAQVLRERGVIRTRAETHLLMMTESLGRTEQELRDEVTRLADRNLSIAEVSRRTGVSVYFVTRWFPRRHRLSKAESSRRRYWEADTPDVNERIRLRGEIVAMRMRYLRGESDVGTYAEISAATGAPIHVVSGVIARCGLTYSAAAEDRAWRSALTILEQELPEAPEGMSENEWGVAWGRVLAKVGKILSKREKERSR